MRRVLAVLLVLLAVAGLIWLRRANRSGIRTVQHTIAGQPASVEESGSGPDIVIVGGSDVVRLASALAADHRVSVVPASALDRPGGVSAAQLLNGLNIAGDVTVVAAVPAMAQLVAAPQSQYNRTVRLAALDVDPEAPRVKELFVGDQPFVFLLSGSSGAAWRSFRGAPAAGRLSISIVDGCEEGLTAECVTRIAPVIAAVGNDSTWVATGRVIEDELNSGGKAPAFVVVPNGRLMASHSVDMSAPAEKSETAVVTVNRLAVAMTETTVAAFRRFVAATHYSLPKGCWYHTQQQQWRLDPEADWTAPVFTQTDQHPVTCVMYEDAVAYAEWLSAQTGHRYRLPTEAELVFLNRSGHAGQYGFDIHDETELCAHANGADRAAGFKYSIACNDGFHDTSPVGSFPPNDFGLYDATGNLWELTTDCFRGKTSGGACFGPHVMRGGSYLSSPENLSLAKRESDIRRTTRVGFRLVRELP